jgi:Carboxypeptidase regulatory-like domain
MRKFWVLGVVMVLCLGANGGGCNNPNGGGVQQFGTVVGRVLDATNNRPVAKALVSVGSIWTAYSDPGGAFMIPNIPIGAQEVTASAAGYESNSSRARIHEHQTTNIGYLRIMPLTGGPTAPAPPTPSPTPGLATPIPALTPAPASSGTSSP